MRSLVTRRVALAAGVATVAVIALSGCSAGQVAETAMLQAPISGLNTASPDGGLLIRNLQVIYNNPAGYPANGNAPLEVSLFNETEQPITVLISSRPQQPVTPGVVSAQQVGVTGTAPAGAPSSEPTPSASASAPATTAVQPARFTIAPLSTESFIPGDAETLQVVGLSDRLTPGTSVNLVFEVSTSDQPLEVQAPFGIPTSPASRAPGLEHENEE